MAKTFKAEYLFASPVGDILLDDEKLDSLLPFSLTDFETTVNRTGPRLTYRDYFNCISDFLSENSWYFLLDALSRKSGATSLSDIARLLIRSEKHGSMYHIASVQAEIDGAGHKFAVTTAISEPGKCILEQDFRLLSTLTKRFPYSYLPSVYSLSQSRFLDRTGLEWKPLLMLGDWLEGYHEFHLSNDGATQAQGVVLWDYSRGNRYLSKPQRQTLFKEISKILTLYYDPATFEQISAWHHAAGDFIASAVAGENIIRVRLVTVRRYESLIQMGNNGKEDSLAALLHFLLLLSIKIRLDRMDGIGEPAWTDVYCVDASMAGFLEALNIKEEAGELSSFTIDEFITSIKALELRDWEDLAVAILQTCPLPASDMPLIVEHLDHHLEELFHTVQKI